MMLWLKVYVKRHEKKSLCEASLEVILMMKNWTRGVEKFNSENL